MTTQHKLAALQSQAQLNCTAKGFVPVLLILLISKECLYYCVLIPLLLVSLIGISLCYKNGNGKCNVTEMGLAIMTTIPDIVSNFYSVAYRTSLVS